MNTTFRRLAALAIVAPIQGSMAGLVFAQANPPPSTDGGQPRQYAAPVQHHRGPRHGCRELPASDLPCFTSPVSRSCNRHRAQARHCAGDGLTSSQGWSTPQLVPTFWASPSTTSSICSSCATAPVQSQAAEGFVPIGAVFTGGSPPV
jgi:hypothetical protein